MCREFASDGPCVAPEFNCKSVIKVYHYEFIDKWPKQLSHHSHEGVKSIEQSKEHNQPFIQSILSFKGSLSFIFWLNSNLVVPTLRSILEKIVAPDIKSIISSKWGMGKRYLTVILLIARLSTHIRHVPSFFGAKSVRTAHGLKLSLMNPLSSNSSTCRYNFACSVGFIL